MGINTDLNVDPYYDDFSEEKQFNRILFKPAKAVQARELTQIQSILQKQVERFGSNIYKEGTIISGINLTDLPAISYVKLEDTGDIDPTLYGKTDDVTYTVTGRTTGLVAEIKKGVGGFKTQEPDLKTFFITYITNPVETETSVKEFQAGEQLDVTVFKAADLSAVTIYGEPGDIVAQGTVATIDNHVGRAAGISCEEGVIYQKGHFIFVTAQDVITSKYSLTPGSVSVGFTINELLISSGIDVTLLDNAAGFNNENAPGADRLKLVPTLIAVETADEPEEFFALKRYVDGNPVRIRDTTQFNSIATEMARRTYDESGNYVTEGFGVSLELANIDGTTKAYAAIAPGKAYVFGNEVRNISSRRLEIVPTEETETKPNEMTGASYGQYYKFDNRTGEVTAMFATDGTRNKMYNAAEELIGYCSIANVTAGAPRSTTGGRIYVYAIVKSAGQENSVPTRIAKGDSAFAGTGLNITSELVSTNPTVNSSVFYDPNIGGKIFDAGKSSMKSISDVKFTRQKAVTTDSQTSVSITSTDTEQPIITNAYAISNANEFLTVTPTLSGNVATFGIAGGGPGTVLYYDAIISGTTQDALEEKDVYVKSQKDSSGIASLGLPNCIEILEIVDEYGQGADVTSDYRLVNNQKENFYDISYIKLLQGRVSANANLRIKVKFLDRPDGINGYLTVDSYSEVEKYSTITLMPLIKDFASKSGLSYDLLNCFDFRPYAVKQVSTSLSAIGAGTVNVNALTLNNSIPIQNDTLISSQQIYNMSRIDTIFIDDLGEIAIEKGKESETPSINKVEPDQYSISTILVPGGTLRTTGSNKLQLSDVSNKNYTMREIGKLEKQIERLTELASLTLLESSAKDLLIRGADGQNRFKNGILVDAFRDMKVASLIDPEFNAAIDRSRTVASPSIIEFPIDLKVVASEGINQYSDVVTLQSTETVTFIEQKYATNFRNCVSNFYSYDGVAVLHPPFDASYDVTQNPAINIDIDNAGPTLDLISTLGEFMPLTVEDPEVLSFAGNVGNGPNRNFKVDLSTTTRSLETNVRTSTQNVGNFITDWSMSPYMQSREVKILVTGLRGNVEHFFYFEQTPIAANVYPGTIDTSPTEFNVEDVEISGELGAPVRSDENGTLAAVFRIPAATFFVGQTTLEVVDVDSYANIESASTSYGKALYRAYSFDISKSELSVTTRSVDVSVGTSTTVRSFQVPNPCDPIAQTFMVRTSQAAGASVMYIESLDLFFKKKADTTGITVEIREVVNGYPSRTVLPFARKHIKSSQVNTSDDGSLVTVVTFRNPIKLHTEKEYCFVILPDQNSPDYLIWTAKVGSTDQASGAAITNDWGEGVLFTSTNDSAWKSYQDEDIKFTLKRYNFSAQPGTVDLVPNEVEFLTIANRTRNFINDELVYVNSGGQGTGFASISPDGKVVTLTGPSSFSAGDYILLTKGDGEAQIKHLSKIVTVSGSAQTGTAYTLKTPCNPTTTITVAETGFKSHLAVVGRVSHFNKSRGNRLFLRDSTARASNFFAATGQTDKLVYGYSSGAFATIVSVDNEQISYFQTQIFMNNSIKTSSDLTLYKGGPLARVIDKGIDSRSNTYMMNNLRSINSKSNILSTTDTQDFMIRATMTNNGFVAATPILDSELSMLNVYKYNITPLEATTSKWISKEVTLADNLDAVGLKVFLSAYRPAGTFIDVYARFVYPTDAENQSDWTQLTNNGEAVYSNLLNTRDYREFEYDLPTETDEYSSFQIKIVLRHVTTDELNTFQLYGADGINPITPGANIFPHVYDYRAIALT